MYRLMPRLVVASALVALVPALALTQPPPDRTIDAAERDAVIAGVLEKVEAHYVFPDVGKKMAEAVRGRQAKKEYDGIASAKELADTLTKHLREVSKDLHLGVRHSPEPLAKAFDRGPTEEQRKRMRERAALRNFGFKKVERLGVGGVGLLELEGFMPAELIGETAAAAMTVLANNEAVIIDLRKNGGGDPEAVILLCSYFFDDATHLNSIYTRTTDTTRQYWSHPVAGKKLLGKDVYVLTSKRTFSAAEEFAYNLQSQTRATIVGETTGGGAHPTRGFRVTDHFGVGVPFARSINPVTKTNWEGTGVKPDVAVPADQALPTAHLLALKKAAERYAGDKDMAAVIAGQVKAVQKELDDLKPKDGPASRDDAPEATLDTLDARMKWEAERGFAGVVLVARGGKVAFHKAYGMANREKKIEMTPETIFGIGSTPIDFTRAGILLLADRGKVGLTDPIGKYFADVPEDKKAMTLEHLMTGRSGLQDFHDVESDRDKDHSWIDRAEAVRRILGQKLLFAPGTKRAHSHSAFGLLAAVIEIASGQSYQDFTRKHLFEPAGMTDTGFFGDKLPERRTAVGYGPEKDGAVNAPPYWGKTSWLVMGSGGQVSTALDMWKWARAVRGGKLLSPESTKEFARFGQGMLVGGDMYGFEIMCAGSDQAFMVVVSNTGSPKRMAGLRKLGRDLTALVVERKAGKFTLGVMLAVEDGGQVKIDGLVAGGAAEKAGLKVGDVLLKAGGKPVGGEPLAVLAPLLQAGDPIAVEVERDGKKLTVSVKPVAR